MPTNTNRKMISFWSRLLNLISPQACPVCGGRMTVGEALVCGKCTLQLPRTGYSGNAYRNEMAKLFWLQIPIERAAAWFFYEAHSPVSRLLYRLKYANHPETGEEMGRMMAQEMQADGFFDGIDAIIPVPLTRKRQRERGYNQSMEIAHGVSGITGIPILKQVLVRTSFAESQTRKHRRARIDNVEDAFELKPGTNLQGKHLLIIDDVVTTGATVIACGRQLMKGGDVRISVLTIGFAKS